VAALHRETRNVRRLRPSNQLPVQLEPDPYQVNKQQMNQTPEQLTDFANVEEDFADSAVWEMKLLPRDKHVMPWRIEDEMKKIGANYIQAGLWKVLIQALGE
jgi:hypothetical protein